MRLEALLLGTLTQLVALGVCQNTGHGRSRRLVSNQRTDGVADDEDFNLDPTIDDTPLVVGPSVHETVGKCGITKFPASDDKPTSEIADANFGEFPWMVALLLRKGDDPRSNYLGGGSLINPSVVMTVAHKLERRRAHHIKVRVGEWDMNSDDERYTYQDRNVDQFIIHEDYFRASLYNDIALLFLDAPVRLAMAPHIGIGCLSSQPPPPGAVCYSMGWGANDFHNKTIRTSVLKKVKLPVVERSQCEARLRERKYGKCFRLHPSLLCAGGQSGVDTCRGDGGSPLVCPTDSKGTRYAIYGMVAYGDSCGQSVPGVYANVANLYEWVKRKFAEMQLSSEIYRLD